MKYTLLVTYQNLLVSITAFAQSSTEAPELDSDRPNFTQAASVIPHKTIQLETGLEFRNDASISKKEKIFLYPTTLVRIGVFKKAEFRVNFDFEEDRQNYSSESSLRGSKEVQKGFDNVQLGAKIALFEGESAIPAISVLGNVTLPVGNKEFRPPHAAPEGRLLFNSKLSENLELQYNVGYRKLKDQEDYRGEMLYSVAANLNITDSFKVFAEYEVTKAVREAVDSSLDGGLLLKLLPNLQLDIYTGAGVSESAPDFYTGAGITWRLPQ